MPANVKKILFPTDFSDMANGALPAAVSFAKLYGATLHIVHVVENIFDISGFYVPHLPADEMYENMKEYAEKELQNSLSERITDAVETATCILAGSPADQIVEYANNNEIDIIVIASHGRSGLEHLFFGSVTEKVLRKCKCSILVVKNQALT